MKTSSERRWRARILSPVDEAGWTWLEDALVVVRGGRLAHVGPFDGGAVDEDLRHGVLLPGFVDSHVHAAQTRIVGHATGGLLDWLQRSVFPEEARLADPAVARVVAQAFTQRIAAAGTTLCVALGSVHEGFADAVFGAMSEAGLQGFVAPAWMDEHSPEPLQTPVDDSVAAHRRLRERWHGHDDGRLQLAVFPRFALSCSRRAMTAAAELAAEHDLLVTTHLSETVGEEAAVRERFGVPDYLTVYEQCGLLGARSLFAHCVQLEPGAWDRLAGAGAAVAHCPDSNDFLGSGGMPVGEPLRRGVPISVGTDVAAGRSFRVPRTLSSAYDNGLRQGLRVRLAQLLWWGTRGGALALGCGHTGALEVGLQADATLFEPPEGAESPRAVLEALFFDHDTAAMKATWVRGREVWRDQSERSSNR